jgi:hypothetical protein
MTSLYKTKFEFELSTAHNVHIFLFFTKMVQLKAVWPLKIYKNTKFHGPMLTAASSVSTLQCRTSAILEQLKV